MTAHRVDINEALVCRLLAAQFPCWSALPVRQVLPGGWDNRSFRVGDQLIARLPSAECYATQPPLPIPAPVAMGEPGDLYPWHWSLYQWIEGEPLNLTLLTDRRTLAVDLAYFLTALQRVNSTDGPSPGAHNFFRGAHVAVYAGEVHEALRHLRGQLDVARIARIWEEACDTVWLGAPVWINGDIAAGNLLLSHGRLSSVIDFGGLAIGDPACDLAAAWTLFDGESRNAFQSALPTYDQGTWKRARAWVLWKGLILAAGMSWTNTADGYARPNELIATVVADE